MVGVSRVHGVGIPRVHRVHRFWVCRVHSVHRVCRVVCIDL